MRYVHEICSDHMGDGNELSCFDCGSSDGLLLVNDEADPNVSELAQVRCGACWARKLARESEDGYALSLMAAAINWSDGDNTREWLDDLHRGISLVQTGYTGCESGMTMARLLGRDDG